MKKLNKDSVELKNILGIIQVPSILDLLYEIVLFLDTEGRIDGVFTTKELTNKTKVRVSASIDEDLQSLIEKGYVANTNNKGRYVVTNHLWEC